ncbi:hypothetical protein [Nisaea sp.]|uniref:hypothetical protein n=1 Tax=Nisaea sp. TaxID=2024842 RepID=UPI002B270A5C|nr:hypothetical protein [Nisaea sp.]
MEISLPHQVIYDTEEASSVSDVVDSLLATEQAAKEAAVIISGLIDGFRVRRVSISVNHISQKSPLRELFTVALLIAYQDDLNAAVPKGIEEMLGVDLPGDHSTLITVVTLVVLFYGADFLIKRLGRVLDSNGVRAQLDQLIGELAEATGKPEETIRATLESRYSGRRMVSLSRTALRFFAPSKNQRNAKIIVGNRSIPSNIVAQVPGDTAEEVLTPDETSEQLQDVEIELHAQDVDYSKRGWAAVIPELSPDRMQMRIFPPTRPEDIWTKQKIRGDVIVVYQVIGGESKPRECHLVRLTG